MSNMRISNAGAGFECRFRELQAKARHYFEDFTPEAKDEAQANLLFLRWRGFHALVGKGLANDALLRSTFYFSCRQTRSRRTMRGKKGSKSREVFGRKGGEPVISGINVDPYVGKRHTVLDTVALRIDTTTWLESLTEKQRRRALQLSEGNATSELAGRWHVSPVAVSVYRRQLHESYERFIGR
jgi:hypothetical protein